MWATPFATREGKPVYELLGSELGPGGESFGNAIFIDSNIEEATGTEPGPRGQLERTGRCCLPGRPAARDGRRAASPGRRRRAGPRGPFRRPALVEPRRDQPQPVLLDAGAHAGKRAVIGDRADRQGGRRVAGARRRRRSADLGEAPVRQRRRLRDAGERDGYNGVPVGVDADAPSVASSASGRRRSPTASPEGRARPSPVRASSSTSSLMVNPRMEPSSKAPASSTPRWAVAPRQAWAHRASTSTNSRACACSTTATGCRGCSKGAPAKPFPPSSWVLRSPAPNRSP